MPVHAGKSLGPVDAASTALERVTLVVIAGLQAGAASAEGSIILVFAKDSLQISNAPLLSNLDQPDLPMFRHRSSTQKQTLML